MRLYTNPQGVYVSTSGTPTSFLGAFRSSEVLQEALRVVQEGLEQLDRRDP